MDFVMWIGLQIVLVIFMGLILVVPPFVLSLLMSMVFDWAGRIVGYIVLPFAVILGVAYLPWMWQSPLIETLSEGVTSYSEFKKARGTEKPYAIEHGIEIRRFYLVKYSPPKHFYVTLKDVETGVVSSDLYVSKHCNRANENKPGDQFNIGVRKYAMSDQPDKILYQFQNLYSAFC
jgi:hypothetical protein